MSGNHLSTQFDTDLNRLFTKLLEMGGLVESQIAQAMKALNRIDFAGIERVIADERQLNAMEVQLDEQIISIIVRRQPAARDLRALMAVSKCITNLERAGDEARTIAKGARRIAEHGTVDAIDITEIKASGEMAMHMLRRALDAFARLDTAAAAQIVRDDQAIDNEFRAFVRKLIPYMMEAPRTISVCLDYLFIAKAIERIGDHATNIAEFIVYVVKGTDVRHLSGEQLEREAMRHDD